MATDRIVPLDHPTRDRPHRLYFALTNHCNRACPWCSTYSSPAGSTWLSVEQFRALLPEHAPFEVQLEGGEPTMHPDFVEFVRLSRAHPQCTRLVVCTNGVLLPRKVERLREWVLALGAPLTVKLSINHHLLERDPTLLTLATNLRDAFAELGDDRLLVTNVRLRRGVADDDRAVWLAVEEAGLIPHANVFFLQRYGLASDRLDWDAPFLAGTNFTIINPDGARFGTDLITRSEAMGRLP